MASDGSILGQLLVGAGEGITRGTEKIEVGKERERLAGIEQSKLESQQALRQVQAVEAQRKATLANLDISKENRRIQKEQEVLGFIDQRDDLRRSMDFVKSYQSFAKLGPNFSAVQFESLKNAALADKKGVTISEEGEVFFFETDPETGEQTHFDPEMIAASNDQLKTQLARTNEELLARGMSVPRDDAFGKKKIFRGDEGVAIVSDDGSVQEVPIPILNKLKLDDIHFIATGQFGDKKPFRVIRDSSGGITLEEIPLTGPGSADPADLDNASTLPTVPEGGSKGFLTAMDFMTSPIDSVKSLIKSTGGDVSPVGRSVPGSIIDESVSVEELESMINE